MIAWPADRSLIKGGDVKALKNNHSITDLDLSNNSIGAQGGGNIAELLEYNNTLLQINLDGNRIGREGLESIIQALARNNSLTSLSANIVMPLTATDVNFKPLRYIADFL